MSDSEWTIYNNTTPFGLLTDEQKAALKEHDGSIAFWRAYERDWHYIEKPSWCASDVYRAVKPEPKPSQVTDWSVLRDDIIAVAWDDVYEYPSGYNFIPKLSEESPTYWQWPTRADAVGFGLNCISPKILIRGDVPWHETLCIRPGYEEKAE